MQITRSTVAPSFYAQKSNQHKEIGNKKERKKKTKQNKSSLSEQPNSETMKKRAIDLVIPAAPVTRTRTGSLAIVRIVGRGRETKTTPANLICYYTYHCCVLPL